MTPNFTREEWDYIIIRDHEIMIHEECPKELQEEIKRKIKTLKEGANRKHLPF